MSKTTWKNKHGRVGARRPPTKRVVVTVTDPNVDRYRAALVAIAEACRGSRSKDGKAAFDIAEAVLEP